MSIDSTELFTSVASISLSLAEFSDLESCKLIKMGFNLDTIEKEDSPHPKDHVFVSNINDSEMPTLTFRTQVIPLPVRFCEKELGTVSRATWVRKTSKSTCQCTPWQTAQSGISTHQKKCPHYTRLYTVISSHISYNSSLWQIAVYSNPLNM